MGKLPHFEVQMMPRAENIDFFRVLVHELWVICDPDDFLADFFAGVRDNLINGVHLSGGKTSIFQDQMRPITENINFLFFVCYSP